jgi:hypothetical protein
MRVLLASVLAAVAFAGLFGAFSPMTAAIEQVLDQTPSAVCASMKDRRPGVRHVID